MRFRVFNPDSARLPLAIALAAALLTAGCGPGYYRRQADERAYDIVERAGKEAMGARAHPFTIEQPSDLLRRRLLLEQELPTAHAASLGTSALEPIPHWPEKDFPRQEEEVPGGGPASRPAEPLTLTLEDALQVAAGNNRAYQSLKEDVFRTALALDLEANEFRSIFAAAMDTVYTEDLSGSDPVRGVEASPQLSVSRQFKQGTVVTAAIAMDLVKLLTGDRSETLGLTADATVTVPLLRGAGRYIVAEPLTQAERNVVYALYELDRSRRVLAVRVASDYLGVLQQLDQVDNAEDNYRRVAASTRRARRLADAGRLPGIQVDQALQDELRARDRWITAQQGYAGRLDSFKITLGLPADAGIVLSREELDKLSRMAGAAMAAAQAPAAPAGSELPAGEPPAATPADSAGLDVTANIAATAPARGAPAQEESPQAEPEELAATTGPSADEPVELVPPTPRGGPLEMPYEQAIQVALENRLDLRTAIGQVYDAQRGVVVAADALKAGLTLAGTASAGESRGLGSADLPNAQLRPERGVYTAGLLVDLPLERTAERNAYRLSLVALEQATRDVQELEDQIKLQIRSSLRTLLEARESYAIQVLAAQVAQRRVASTELFLQAGRAEIRDVLEAQEALISARNAVTAALVAYRVAALEIQRDMDVLEIDEKGLWREYKPY